MSEEAVVQTTEETQTPIPTEAAVEAAPKVEEVVQPDLSVQFADLKRQEKALRAEKHKLKQEQEQTRKQWEEQLKANPIEQLKALGLTPDDLASILLGQEATPKQVDPTEDLRKDLEVLKKEREELQIQQFKQQVFAPVNSDPEAFELILNSKGGTDVYWDAVLQYFNEYGEAPDYKELANEVEAALLEDAKKYLSFKKLAPPKPAEPTIVAPVAVEESPTPASKPKTLTSEMSADVYGRVKVSKADSSAPRAARSEYQAYMDELRKAAIAKIS